MSKPSTAEEAGKAGVFFIAVVIGYVAAIVTLAILIVRGIDRFVGML